MEVDTSDNMMVNIPHNGTSPFFNGRHIFKWLLFAIVMTLLQHHLNLRWCTALGDDGLGDVYSSKSPVLAESSSASSKAIASRSLVKCRGRGLKH